MLNTIKFIREDGFNNVFITFDINLKRLMEKVKLKENTIEIEKGLFEIVNIRISGCDSSHYTFTLDYCYFYGFNLKIKGFLLTKNGKKIQLKERITKID